MAKKPIDPAMAKPTQKKREKFADYKNSKWVLNNLDDVQLALMDSTPFDIERYLDWCAHLVDNGCEVKLTWDTWSNCYLGNVFGTFLGFPNTGYGVSARSDNFADIIKILWFKYEYLCEGDLASAYEAPVKTSRRG